MNFLVTAESGFSGSAAFTEITGIEASVDVIEYRAGNMASLAPLKLAGLVHHGDVTFKFGYTDDTNFRNWVYECTNETRAGSIPRATLRIELLDISQGTPTADGGTTTAGSKQWVLNNAWVKKYTATDFNSTTSDIAYESIEVCYESLEIPK